MTVSGRPAPSLHRGLTKARQHGGEFWGRLWRAATADGGGILPTKKHTRGNKPRAGPFFWFGNAQKPTIAMAGIERGGMSIADPTEPGSSDLVSADTLRAGRSSGKRPADAPDPALREDSDVRSEKPQANPPQTNPEDRKTDRKPPETDQTQEQGPKGIKGAFRKHPIAMVVCLGLIVVGVIAGVAWYLHARHFESTDDAFIDGRPVLVSPQVTGSIISVNVTDNQIVKTGDLLATIDPRNYKAAVDQADAQIRQNEAAERELRSPDRRPEGPDRSGHPAGHRGRGGAQIRQR